MSKSVSSDGLALTPPMGWNSWNSFGGNINQQAIQETADAMVATGLKAAGYGYLVIDDHWHGCRGEDGYLQEDAKKFPDGMKTLADYVHSKGLKFGIYSDAGVKTCGGRPGSFGYERQDAERFAQWDIDFLKYDYCYAPEDWQTAIELYTRMGDALRATGRKILFSVCEWGPRSPWLWARQAGGHMWRVSFDLVNKWDDPQNTSRGIGVLTAIDRMAGLENHAGPGGWNDPDMLIVGLKATDNVGIGQICNEHEQRTNFSMWCMLAAPLMIGCDIRHMSDFTKEILLNPEAIAVSQDPLGKQAIRVTRTGGGGEVWKKCLAACTNASSERLATVGTTASVNPLAVALLNRDEHEQAVTATWATLDLPPEQPMKVRDLWTHRDLGTFTGSVTLPVQPHQCVLLRMEA